MRRRGLQQEKRRRRRCWRRRNADERLAAPGSASAPKPWLPSTQKVGCVGQGCGMHISREAGASLPSRRRPPPSGRHVFGTERACPDMRPAECDCREVKGCRPPPRSRASSVHDFCAYYGAASSAAAAGADGGAPGRPRLYSFDDAPAVLRYNKYIRSGYRAGLSPGQCCASVLQLHNETGERSERAIGEERQEGQEGDACRCCGSEQCMPAALPSPLNTMQATSGRTCCRRCCWRARRWRGSCRRGRAPPRTTPSHSSPCRPASWAQVGSGDGGCAGACLAAVACPAPRSSTRPHAGSLTSPPSSSSLPSPPTFFLLLRQSSTTRSWRTTTTTTPSSRWM